MKYYRRSTAFALAGASIIASLSAPGYGRTISVNQANIAAVLAKAEPGDRLVLASGGYGTVVLPRRTWLKPIKIDARAAELSGVVMRYVSGVIWTGGTIVASVYGVSIRDSSNISISGADISEGARGVVINMSTDIKILNNKFHGLRTDAVDIVGKRILVEGNNVSDMRPVAADHPDGIQVWSTVDFRSSDIVIQKNTITGNSQGIFARASGIGISNLKVLQNKVTVTYPTGIALLDTHDSVATGNTVRSVAGVQNKANMRAVGTGNIICGNTVPDVPKADAAQPCAKPAA